jgi:transcriptional regulator with XRE-family HTH domain
MDPLSTELLPALRRHLHLSQARMADLLGVSRVQLNQAEAGTRPLPVPGRVAFTALVSCLPQPVLAALLQNQAPPLPAAPPGPAALDEVKLAPQRFRLQRELRSAEAALAERLANEARGRVRQALLAAPNAPDLGEAGQRLALEARIWTGTAAQTELRRLRARCEGLRRELAVLDGAE